MTRTALVFALTMALCASAAAQVVPDAPPDRFSAADTNHDGRVDRGEYDGFVQELVLLNDADHDGKLSRSEASSAIDPGKFKMIDANGDGYLAIEEIDVYTASDFAVLDANKDGAVDRAESARK